MHKLNHQIIFSNTKSTAFMPSISGVSSSTVLFSSTVIISGWKNKGMKKMKYIYIYTDCH